MSVAVAPEADDVDTDVDPVAEARAGLKHAFAARKKAHAALEKARAATIRARALVGELGATVEKHSAAGRKVTTMRAGDIATALKAGRPPQFEGVAEIPKIESARLEAEGRLSAARQALEELQRDEARAEAELQQAEASAAAGVKAVVAAAANEMAERVLDLRAEVGDLQEKIGVYAYGFVLRYLNAKSGSALSQAVSGVVWELNSGPWKRSDVYAARWKAWADKLAHDADAELKLD